MKQSSDLNFDGKIGWKELNVKDKIAYVTAVVLIVSGIVMAFLCFFLSGEYSVKDGVLFYCSEAFVSGGGLLGISLYVKNKMSELKNYVEHKEN